MPLHETIPALPVRHVGASIAFQRDTPGFAAVHGEAGFAVLNRNGALEREGWGDRDFAVGDMDHNLITFFEPG